MTTILSLKNDSEILETLFDQKNKTVFCQFKDGETSELNKYEKDKDTIMPINGNSLMLQKKFIRLPSKASAYESNQELFEEIRRFISKYMKLPENFEIISSIYTMLTWLYDEFRSLPYLRVIGDYGTGKSRFLEIMANLCYKPMLIGGSTSIAGLFRTIDILGGTLVFDEADFEHSENWSEMTKILNCGHSANFPVLRLEPNKDKSFDPKTFNIFGPKILASRQKFKDDALESRFLALYLMPYPKHGKTTQLSNDFEIEALELRNKLLMFRFNHSGKLDLSDSLVENIGLPRLQQIFLPMAIISNLVSEQILLNILEFAKTLQDELSELKKSSTEADILICLGTIYSVSGIKEIKIQEIADTYNDKFNPDKRDNPGKGNDYLYNYPNKGWGITAKAAGQLIRKLHIKTKHTGKGYIIPTHQYDHIKRLLERYGITDELIGSSEEVEEIINNQDAIEADF